MALLCSVFCAAEGQGTSPGQGAPGASSSVLGPLPAYPTGENSALGARIQSLLQEPAVSEAHWGVAVTALDGTPLYGLDEGKLFRPASAAKLFTTAAAMAVLGPEHRVSTNIFGDLDATTGVLTGNLVLVGSGDPSFGTTDLPYRKSSGPPLLSKDLDALADALVAKGLRRVTGDVVGDATLFDSDVPEGWAEEDLLWGYGALPSSLSVGDDEVRLTVVPGTSSSLGETTDTRASVDQVTPYLSLENLAVTVPSGEKPSGPIDVSAVPGKPRTLRVIGQIAAGAAPAVEHIAVPDPAQYAAEALRQLLLQRGVQVEGKAEALHDILTATQPYLQALRAPGVGGCGTAYPGQKQNCAFDCLRTPHSQSLLATHTSEPLAEEITFTLKTSANLHAEMLLRQLGLENSCPGAPAVNGARLVRAWLLHAGVAPGDFLLYDGSGLSAKDLVTPRAEAQLLAYAATQPWFAQWKAALPVGGVDGTLAGRFRDPPLKGDVFAKTGTLGESRALAGYVTCASGRQVIFAVMDDNHAPGSAADRKVMDEIVAAIAASE